MDNLNIVDDIINNKNIELFLDIGACVGNYVHHMFDLKKKEKPKPKPWSLPVGGITFPIPEEFKTVDDTGEFLWLRHHLTSGIARGAGNSNILVYSLPLNDTTMSPDNIVSMRDAIGEKYIPGSKEGMYMITEAAYTPRTIKTKFLERNASLHACRGLLSVAASRQI